MQVLGGVTHHEGARVDQAVGEETRVGVCALTHRVVTHVLDATGDHDVVLAEADARRGRGDGGHRAGTHAVDGESWNGFGETGEDRSGAADGQALVTGLRGGCDSNFVDPCGIELRVTAKQLTNRLDDEIVCARVGVHAFRAGLAERGANAVDEDDVALVVCGWSHANSS